MISVPSSTGSVKENQREKREESPAMFAKFIREREQRDFKSPQIGKEENSKNDSGDLSFDHDADINEIRKNKFESVAIKNERIQSPKIE